MRRTILIFALILLSSPLILLADGHEKKAVLVTGASSGIGLNVTRRLAAEGYFVYAGARKEKDLAMLDAMDNVQSVRLDVTVQKDIDEAAAFVKAQGRGLYGIVNNAGVGRFGPSLLEAPVEDMDFMFDVNVFGPFRINQAFAPMVVESKGRIITIGSISAYSPSGIYGMSKAAIDHYTADLAGQLKGAGVGVSMVAPGGYRSRIREKAGAQALKAAEEGKITLTEQQREAFANMDKANEQLKEPDEVSSAVLHALSSDSPAVRYLVTPNDDQARRTIAGVINTLVQLNSDQTYEFSRDELIEMLDAAMAEDAPSEE